MGHTVVKVQVRTVISIILVQMVMLSIVLLLLLGSSIHYGISAEVKGTSVFTFCVCMSVRQYVCHVLLDMMVKEGKRKEDTRAVPGNSAP